MLKLSREIRRKWTGTDVFDQVLTLEGEVYREKDGRRTLSFDHAGVRYFAKIHQGVGWGKIIKYLFQMKLPVLSARNEWEAIQKLDTLGVPTTPLIGWGIRGINPARLQSFVITRELEGMESLEDFCETWPKNKPDHSLKKALIEKVAEIARIIHSSRMTHRDFYICHFLLDTGTGRKAIDPGKIKLYLIDLHRVQTHRRRPGRLILKDIAGLYFSSMDAGLSKRDLFRFIRAYHGQPLKTALLKNRRFWSQVNRRGTSLYRKIFRKNPDIPF